LRVCSLACIALIAATEGCEDSSLHESAISRASRPNGSASVVGRWALVTLMRNGEPVTSRNVTSAGAVPYYTFNADGTFRIALGDSVRETGTWSVDATVSPKVFDHIPDVNGKPGPYVPGIFTIDGDTLKISIIPPNPARRHPTQFRSTAADSSWLLVYTRAAQQNPGR
jgi:uncharacterized protein (TIGR03067 family)